MSAFALCACYCIAVRGSLTISECMLSEPLQVIYLSNDVSTGCYNNSSVRV